MECMYQMLRELVPAFLRATGHVIRGDADAEQCSLGSDMVSMQQNDDSHKVDLLQGMIVEDS